MAIKKNNYIKLLTVIIVFTMLAAMLLIQTAMNPVEASTKYSYASSFISGGGDISTKFNLTISGKKLNGICTQGGPLSDRSGYCTADRLSRTSQRFYLAYYYGYKLGYTSGSNGCDLARAMHYSKYGYAYHQSAEKSKRMISRAKEYCQSHTVPDNFVAFVCNPTNGAQDFVAWGYYESGSAKIIKKSSSDETSRTGAYSLEGISFKVYKSKNTSSKVVGTLTTNKNGTTKALSLAPDGNKAKTYYIRESKTNNSYKLNEKWYSVTVSPGEDAKVTIKNNPEYGSLTFNKAFTNASKEGMSVDGYKFILTNTSDSSIEYTATSKDGVVKFTNILLGKYKLTEKLTKAQIAGGVESVTKPQKVTIKAGENVLGTTDNTFYNKSLLEVHDKASISIIKECDDGENSANFAFNVKGPAGFKKTVITTESGIARLDDLQSGTYYVSEVMNEEQRARYHMPLIQSVEIIEGDVQNIVLEFENKAIKYPVKLKKTATDGAIEGVGFTLTGCKYVGTESQENIAPITSVTDENGYVDFGEFPPGKYVIEETGFDSELYINKYPLKGYSNPAIEFEVKSDGVYKDNKKVSDFTFVFDNSSKKVILTKTEILADGTKTDNPVANAEYTLYKNTVDEEGDYTELQMGSYITDGNGQFVIDPIEFGDYVLYETVVPSGYVNEATTSIDPETGEEILTPEKITFSVEEDSPDVVRLNDTNRQSYGSFLIIKEDEEGNPVEDAEFTVFADEKCTKEIIDADGNPLKKSSDNHGYVIFENVPWGTYYIKETKAPRGYKGSNEVMKAVVGYDQDEQLIIVDYEFRVINERKKGSIELTKVDQDGNIISSSAKYDLFSADGTLIKGNLTTGKDNNGDGSPDGTGIIRVDDLDWNSYYFLEREAPAGYGLSDKKIKFTVNPMATGSVQKITAVDKMITTNIVANKKIKADDIWWPNGTPTFIFKLTGTNAGGNDKSFYRSVTFSQDYVEKHTDGDGYVSMSATFADIDAGKYTLSEENVSRYELSEIEKDTLVNGKVNSDGTVTFDLLSGETQGTATFVNEKYEWKDYSSTELLNNMVKKQRSYTGLAAEYDGEILEGNKPVNNFSDFLTVWALYDDGSEKEISEEAYTVVDIDGNAFTRTPKVAGFYTLTIAHEESGITNFTTIQIQVSGAQKLLVHFNTNGGQPLNELEVWKYDTIEKSTKDSSKYTPVREHYNFKNWFKDEALTNVFNISSTPIIEETTLYADWEKKHINEYGWAELKKIADSGKADEILGECMSETKEDLADGRLTTENLKHTKAFKFNGKTYHAMIAGFDHDEKADGSGKAGISFIVYETVTPSEMNRVRINTGGWGASYMRNTTIASIYNNLSDDMKASIVQVNKTSIYKSNDTEITEVTKDYLWLPSQVELYGAWGYDGCGVESAQKSDMDYGQLLSIKGEGTQYALFKSIVPDGIESKENALIRSDAYWTRSIDFSGAEGFCKVDENGASGTE